MREATCPKCNGTGWVREIKGEKEFVHKCGCKSQDILISKSEKANIPRRFVGYTLKTYCPDKDNPSQGRAKKIVQKFIDDYPAVEKGLLLQGSVGLGKTQLLCTIANELMKKDEYIDIYYIDWHDLVREMRTGEGHNSRDFVSINNLISKLVEVELLLFDEFASSEVSQWVKENIYYLINKRYNDRKMTIFATNFYDEIKEGRETLTERIDKRLRSRLYEMAQSVEIRGVDFRRIYLNTGT